MSNASSFSESERANITERFAKLATAIVCDVYDEFEWTAPALRNDIARRTFERQVVAGWAYPIQGNKQNVPGADRLKLSIVDALPEGCVTVWAGTDAEGIALFGDLIAGTMQKRGCRGAVVDAGVRDVSEVSSTGFPVFSRYVTPVQSIGRWRVTSHGQPVTLRGSLGQELTVSKDDFVLGDEDGVVIIEAGKVMQVLERAEEIVRQEEEARVLRESGMTAQEMLDKYGHV